MFASVVIFCRRHFVATLVLLTILSLPGCQKPQMKTDRIPLTSRSRSLRLLSPEPQVQVQQEDFSIARRHFHTRLLRQGPSPQQWDPVTAPPGVTQIVFPSGSLRLKAWINRPPTAGHHKYPAVLFLHGGWAFGRDDWEMARPYRDAGYIVLTPILRAENGQPGFFTCYYDEVDDVLAAADYLSRQPYVDANRIYVAGHSAGGTLALLAAMASHRFRAAAAFSGSPDQVLFLSQRTYQRVIPFDPSDPREFQMRSPLAYARSFKCPVRLYYGTQEPFFRLTSQRTAQLGQARHLDIEAIEVAGDHFTAVPAAMQQSIAFFSAIGAKSQE